MLMGVLVVPAGVHAATSPLDSPFYDYDGTTPLADIAPGTVLRTRTIPYRIQSVPLPLETVQILYRSTSQIGEPTTNVTSVIRPAVRRGVPKIVAYGSFYDSLDPADQPSSAIAGQVSLTAAVANVETLQILPLVMDGYTVVVPDTQGQKANFGAGHEYGMNTLDALRATLNTPALGLPASTKIGMLGYSGGAIAVEWATELAASYAPDLVDQLVGTAAGGLFVQPSRNLHYIDGAAVWTGVMPMALIGVARAYKVDVSPYLSEYGRKLFSTMGSTSIINALGRLPGLTWAMLVKPEYAKPESIPILVEILNELRMGTGGTPTTPLYFGQGTGGYIVGTPGNKPGIGAGDGVMIAGDARSLARQYCDSGVKVAYREYPGLPHTIASLAWMPSAFEWLNDRFAGKPAPSSCGSIAPGNPLGPVTVIPAG